MIRTKPKNEKQTLKKQRIPPLPENFAGKFLEVEINLSKKKINFEDVQTYIQFCSQAIEYWDNKDNDKSQYYKNKMQNVLLQKNVVDSMKNTSPVKEKPKVVPKPEVEKPKKESVIKNLFTMQIDKDDKTKKLKIKKNSDTVEVEKKQVKKIENVELQKKEVKIMTRPIKDGTKKVNIDPNTTQKNFDSSKMIMPNSTKNIKYSLNKCITDNDSNKVCKTNLSKTMPQSVKIIKKPQLQLDIEKATPKKKKLSLIDDDSPFFEKDEMEAELITMSKFNRNLATLKNQNSERKVNQLISNHQDRSQSKNKILNANLSNQMDNVKSKLAERSQSRKYKTNAMIKSLNRSTSDCSLNLTNMSFQVERLNKIESTEVERSNSTQRNNTLYSSLRDGFIQRTSMTNLKGLNLNEKILEAKEHDDSFEEEIVKVQKF